MIKRNLTLTLLLVLILGKGFLFSQNLMHYTSERYSYSILIPEDWKRSDDVRNNAIALVMVSDETATVSISFYQLKSQSKDQFIDRYEKSLSKQFGEVSLEEKGIFKSRDDEAAYLIYEYTKNEESKREKVCFYNREGEMALITASNSEKSFHEVLPIFDKIFKSFTFETLQDKVEEVD